MNIRFMAVITSILCMFGAKANAQEVEYLLQEQNAEYKAHPEVLVHIPPAQQDNVVIEDKAFVEEANSNQNVAPQAVPENVENNNSESKNISYYVDKLNLTPEQMSRAQEISDASLAKQKELLQSIENLRQQAYDLEKNSLTDFEAILTDEQRVIFNQLRSEKDAGDGQNSVAENAQPNAEPEVVGVVEEAVVVQPAEGVENAQPNAEPEVVGVVEEAVVVQPAEGVENAQPNAEPEVVGVVEEAVVVQPAEETENVQPNAEPEVVGVVEEAVVVQPAEETENAQPNAEPEVVGVVEEAVAVQPVEETE